MITSAGNLALQSGVNDSVELLASLARTEAHEVNIKNPFARGCKVHINITANGGTFSVTPKLELVTKHGLAVLILAGAAMTTNTSKTLVVFPAAPVTANLSVNDFLPMNSRFTMTPTDATSITYSVSIETLN